MISTVRIIGLVNAAIWLGAAVFAAVGAGTAVSSEAMEQLLTARHYPYVSGVIAQLIAERYWHLHIICAVIALLHLSAESLYFGKGIGKRSLALLLALLVLGIAQEMLIQPAMQRLHLAAHATNRVAVQRQAAARAHANWRWATRAIYVLMTLGLGAHLWRVANPPDSTRFLTTGKYRG